MGIVARHVTQMRRESRASPNYVNAIARCTIAISLRDNDKNKRQRHTYIAVYTVAGVASAMRRFKYDRRCSRLRFTRRHSQKLHLAPRIKHKVRGNDFRKKR